MAVKKVCEAQVLRVYGKGDAAMFKLTCMGGTIDKKTFEFFGETEVLALKKAFADLKLDAPKAVPAKRSKPAPKPEEAEVVVEEKPKAKKKVTKKKGK